MKDSTKMTPYNVVLPSGEKNEIVGYVNTAWRELRKYNSTIPDDVLDFMRELALARLDFESNSTPLKNSLFRDISIISAHGFYNPNVEGADLNMVKVLLEMPRDTWNKLRSLFISCDQAESIKRRHAYGPMDHEDAKHLIGSDILCAHLKEELGCWCTLISIDHTSKRPYFCQLSYTKREARFSWIASY